MVPTQQKFTGCARPQSHHLPSRCFTWQNHDVQQKSIGNALPTLRLWHPGPAHSCIAVLDIPTTCLAVFAATSTAWHGMDLGQSGTDARTPTRHHGNNPPDQKPVPMDMILDGS